MKKIQLFLIVVFSLGLFNQALACSCKRFTYEEQIDNAQWIFTAAINKLELLDEHDDWGRRLIEIGFTMEEPIKGEVELLPRLTTGTGTCGVDYEILRTYLIMADQSGLTNICTGTMQIVAEEQYSYFEEIPIFISEIKAYLAGKLVAISTFYNPVTKRTINGPQKPVKSGCEKSGNLDE